MPPTFTLNPPKSRKPSGSSNNWPMFLAVRLGHAMLVVWLAYTVAFFLLWVLPGDAALARLGGADGGSVTADDVADMRRRLGLDAPIYLQYLQRLGDVLHGDLGLSLRNDRPVTQIIAAAIAPTAQLAGIALLLALLVGGSIAVAANLTRAAWLNRVLLSLPAVGTGIPVFWAGLLLISAFSFTLRIFPAGGNSGPQSLVLPAIALAIIPASLIANVLAASLREALAAPYASTTAPAKGAGRIRVVMVHCLRNAALPTLTVLGVITGSLLAGTVVIDTVFSRAGIGRVMLDAVGGVDLTVVQGVVLLAAVCFVTINLLVDLLYPLIDPRMRTRFGKA